MAVPAQSNLDTAVRSYWTTRDKQAKTGKGEGLAGAVRGGKHFDLLGALVADVFLDAGYGTAQLMTNRSATVPGYFRATKNWDLIVVSNGRLVAAFELKGLGSESAGNNANNRLEESLGSAVDLRRAYDAGLLGETPPWIGYVYLMEDHLNTRNAVALQSVKAGQPDPQWVGRSYMKRAELSMGRLQEAGVYDAVCFAITSRDPFQPTRMPRMELSWERFVARVQARIDEVGPPQPSPRQLF